MARSATAPGESHADGAWHNSTAPGMSRAILKFFLCIFTPGYLYRIPLLPPFPPPFFLVVYI